MPIGATVTCSFDAFIGGNNGDPAHTNTVTATVEDDDLNTASDGDSATVSFGDALPSIDVTKAAGVHEPTGKGLGIVCVDFDDDARDLLDPDAGADELPQCAAVVASPFTDRTDARPITAPDLRTGFTFAVFGDRTGGPAEGVAVLANAVFLPLAGKLETRSREEVMNKEMVIEGIMAIQSGDSPRIVEEKLKSFLSPTMRRKVDDAKQVAA